MKYKTTKNRAVLLQHGFPHYENKQNYFFR